MDVRLRPIRADEIDLLHGFHHDPIWAGHNWVGFRSASHLVRDHAENGFLSDDLTRLLVEVDGAPAGMVTFLRGRYSVRSEYYEIGCVLRPEHRGRGVGWRAQAILTDYIFEHMPVQRVQAGTSVDNLAEQKSLVKAGFQLEGVVRSAEFRAGRWRDCMLYSRLRDDPSPEV